MYDLVVGWVRSGIRIRILNIGLIKDTEVGRLNLHIMLAIAEFERNLIGYRTQGGRAYQRMTNSKCKEARNPVCTIVRQDYGMELLKDNSFSRV